MKFLSILAYLTIWPLILLACVILSLTAWRERELTEHKRN